MKQKPSSQREDSKASKIELLFKIIAVAYGVILIISLIICYFTACPRGKITGLIIGSLYVIIALFYFYDNFILIQREESVGRSLPHGTNLRGWLIKWIFPAVGLQAFVVLGFFLTVDQHHLKGKIYTHPYRLGNMYRTMEIFENPAGNIPKRTLKELIEYEEWIVDNFWSAEVSQLKENPNGTSLPPKTDSAIIRETAERLKREVYGFPFAIALTFGFLGTLIYTLQDTAYRYFTTDLYPKTYIKYLVRFIFAPSVCLVVAYFFMNDWPVNLAPLLFFCIGLFPQIGVDFIEEKARALLRLKKGEKKREIPLMQIQGMSDYIIFRFREVGVINAQNLAFSDFPYLRNNVGFSDRRICDYIAQALLLVHLEKDFTTLQNFGIRDILAFETVLENEKDLKSIAEQMGIASEKLSGVRRLLQEKRLKKRVNALRNIIARSVDKEVDRVSRMLGEKQV